MTGKIAEKLLRYGTLLKERVAKRCPYKEHFCNGDPVVPGKGTEAKKPCRYFVNGKCRNAAVSIAEIAERCE